MTQPAFNLKERKDPTFVKFADGECVEGVFVKKTMQPTKSEGRTNMTARYTVQDITTGEMTEFLGTYQINSKLSPRDLGHYIAVRCEGEDKNVTRNGNSMKIFKVMVSEAIVPGWVADGSQITDEDLPTF
jgi:hypothetical protein